MRKHSELPTPTPTPSPRDNIHSYPAAIQHCRRLSLGVPTQGNQTLARTQMCWLVEYPISPSPWWQLQCGWRSRDLGFSHHIFKPSACVWRHRCNYLSSASTPLRKKKLYFLCQGSAWFCSCSFTTLKSSMKNWKKILLSQQNIGKSQSGTPALLHFSYNQYFCEAIQCFKGWSENF